MTSPEELLENLRKVNTRSGVRDELGLPASPYPVTTFMGFCSLPKQSILFTFLCTEEDIYTKVDRYIWMG